MRGKTCSAMLVIWLIFTVGLMAAINPAKALEPLVKVYVDQPLGYIPLVAPGGTVQFDIIIETSGITDDSPGGIVQWAMDIRVNPDSLNISGGRAVGATSGYFLWEFADWYWYDYPTFFVGTQDADTGYWDELSEVILPTPEFGGAGDDFSGLKLVTIRIRSASDTIPCLIDLIDVAYRQQDGSWHSVDVVEDGYYGTPPTFMSETADPFDPTDPVGSRWHELYPNYCRYYDLVGWTDNTDGTLSASDQITMVNETGWIYQYHVDKVTTTIHWTFKEGGLGDAEPVEPNLLDEPIYDPIGTVWHQIYPDYSREFVITSWEDNGNDVFDASDQFDFEYFGEGTVYWAHLDSVTTDIILSQKGEPEPPPVPEFPLGLEIMMMLAAAIPIVYIWRTRKWSGKK